MIKDIVEALFEAQLVRLLYCTETFAVGLNFPCRSVCFDSATKWDGKTFRSLTNREYFQMAGRAETWDGRVRLCIHRRQL